MWISDFSDFSDNSDYSNYIEYRDSDLEFDLDWERCSELVT